MPTAPGLSPRELFDQGDYSGAIAKSRELALHAGPPGRLLRKVGRAFDPAQPRFMAGRPDAHFVARTEAIRLARTVSRSLGEQINDLLSWWIASAGDLRKSREYDRRVAELCVHLWERLAPIPLEAPVSGGDGWDELRRRFDELKRKRVGELLDNLDPEVQKRRSEENRRRRIAAMFGRRPDDRELDAILNPSALTEERGDSKSSPQESAPELSKEARVMATLIQYPGVSDTEIARRAGVNRTSLYRMAGFRKAREVQRLEKARLRQKNDAE